MEVYVKKIAIAVLAIACVLAASSCQLVDSLFYNAEGVKASELPEFTGSAASSEAEARVAVKAGLGAGAVPVGKLAVSGPSGGTIARAFPRLLQLGALEVPAEGESSGTTLPDTTAASRALPAGSLKVNQDGSISYNWSGTEYSVSSNPAVTVSGSFKYDVSADANSDLLGVDVKASLDADIQAKIGEYAPAGLKGAVMNLKAKGDARLTGTPTAGYSAKGYAAASMFAGFSLDEKAGHKGGKYIVKLKYVENYDVNVKLADIEGSAGANVDLQIEVKVYGKDNKLLNTYSWSAKDFLSDVF